jgi:integrase
MQTKTRKNSHWITAKDGWFIVRSKVYEEGKTRYPQRSFRKKNEAEAYLRELEKGGSNPPDAFQDCETTEEIEEQATRPAQFKKARRILVREILEWYRDSRNDLAAKTKISITDTVKHIDRFPHNYPLGGMVAHTVRQEHIEAYIVAAKRSGLSASTLHARVAYFFSAWRAASKEFQLPSLARPKIPQPREINLKSEYIPKEIQIQIAEKAKQNKDWRILLMWYLGSQLALRIGEIMAVCYEDFHLEQNSNYPYGYLIVNKKLGLNKEFEPTKTKDIRHLALTPMLWELMSDKVGEGRITAPFDLRWGAPTIRRLLLSVGLDKGNSHRMRHTAATSLLLAGASLIETRAVTGHRSLAMLERYEHTAGEIRGQAAARLGAWLTEAAE